MRFGSKIVLPTLLSLFIITFNQTASAKKLIIKDNAHFFTASLSEKLEKEVQLSSTNLIIESHNSLAQNSSAKQFFKDRANSYQTDSVFIMLIKQPKKLWLTSTNNTRNLIKKEQLESLRSKMLSHFKNNDFDAGLLAAISQLRAEENSAPKALNSSSQVPSPKASTEFPLKRVLFFMALILGLFFLFSFLKKMLTPKQGLNRNSQQDQYGQNNGMGMGMGGGGFLQNMLGGVAGAMAGSWMYDKFFGNSASANPMSEPPSSPAQGVDPDPGFGSSSDDFVGDFGGGDDWGGGDFGGGGDDW